MASNSSFSSTGTILNESIPGTHIQDLPEKKKRKPKMFKVQKASNRGRR